MLYERIFYGTGKGAVPHSWLFPCGHRADVFCGAATARGAGRTFFVRTGGDSRLVCVSLSVLLELELDELEIGYLAVHIYRYLAE